MPKYFFRCSCEVAELGRYLRDVELEFPFDTPEPSLARLSRSNWNGQKPDDPASAICTAETTREATHETEEFLRDTMGALYANVLTPTVTIFRWRCGLAEGPPSPFPICKGSTLTTVSLGIRHPDSADLNYIFRFP